MLKILAAILNADVIYITKGESVVSWIKYDDCCRLQLIPIKLMPNVALSLSL